MWKTFRTHIKISEVKKVMHEKQQRPFNRAFIHPKSKWKREEKNVKNLIRKFMLVLVLLYLWHRSLRLCLSDTVALLFRWWSPFFSLYTVVFTLFKWTKKNQECRSYINASKCSVLNTLSVVFMIIFAWHMASELVNGMACGWYHFWKTKHEM